LTKKSTLKKRNINFSTFGIEITPAILKPIVYAPDIYAKNNTDIETKTP